MVAGLEDISAAVGRDALLDLFSAVNEYASDYARTRGADLVTEITETTRDRLASMIEAAFQGGATPQDLALEIAESFAFSIDRAETIARTELAMAQGQGTLDSWIESEVVSGKRWILGSEHGDPDICDDNEAAGVIGLEETFPSGDDAPPAHPDCVCDLIAELIDVS